MSGWIVVTDSPVGVSDKNGTFVVRNVPAGTYTATAWHEKLGQQTAQVTVPASGEATVSFTFGK
jgi:hypothetical protein